MSDRTRCAVEMPPRSQGTLSYRHRDNVHMPQTRTDATCCRSIAYNERIIVSTCPSTASEESLSEAPERGGIAESRKRRQLHRYPHVDSIPNEDRQTFSGRVCRSAPLRRDDSRAEEASV